MSFSTQSAHLLINERRADMVYRKGILAWYDSPISTAKVEGIHNKIKVLKRVGYGFRTQHYLNLRLYTLNHAFITRDAG